MDDFLVKRDRHELQMKDAGREGVESCIEMGPGFFHWHSSKVAYTLD